MNTFVWYLIGGLVGIMLYISLFDNKHIDKIVESKNKPTIDYKLESNNKQIDTIWIYTFKKQ